MTGMLKDLRRNMIERANKRGFTVKGRNGEVLPGKLAGYGLEFPLVHVAHPFGPVSFEISWALVKRIADGQTTQVEGF